MAAGGNIHEVSVTAKAVGEDAYQRHAQGLDKVKQKTKEVSAAAKEQNAVYDRSLIVAIGLQSAFTGMAGGMNQLKILSNEQTIAMMRMIGAIQLAVSVYRLLKLEAIKSAVAIWQQAIAKVASGGLFAPVIAAALIGAVGGAVAAKPSLVGLAEGGVVTRPTTALIGEAGREAVIPLDRPEARRTLQQAGFGGKRTSIIINGDPRLFDREMRNDLE